MKEMIVYAVFTLFFFGAGINSAIVAAHLAELKNNWFYHATYRQYYPPAVAATVMCSFFTTLCKNCVIKPCD